VSILIRGLDMPTDGRLFAVIIDSASGEVMRPREDGVYADVDGAKAVPVPPHGRLGDIDKLIEKIDGIWDCNDMVFKPDDHCCNIPEDCKGCKWAQTKDCIRRMVENAPTIIEADKEVGV